MTIFGSKAEARSASNVRKRKTDRAAQRVIPALLFFVWTTFVLVAYYVVQRPLSADVARGIAGTVWTIAVAGLLVVNAAGLGSVLLRHLAPAGMAPTERLLLGTGVGLGTLGLAGLALASAGMTSPILLASVLLALVVCLWYSGLYRHAWHDLKTFLAGWWSAEESDYALLRIAAAMAGCSALLLALAPPDAFDALLYHLTWPAWVLRDGGLRAYNVSPFWHPGLIESTFLWALALGSDRAPQLLHLTWATLTVALIWHWAAEVWNRRIAWLSLALLVSMPSLPLLASWAYTDLALAFYVVAGLYTTWRWQTTRDRRWLTLAGIGAGMAMGVKYTSFVLPVTLGALIAWWSRPQWREGLKVVVGFGLVAGTVAAPWYLRNWLVMGNPFYPFVFGGRYWDAFRAAWYADAGTGIGLDPVEIFLLPLNATLGHRDANFYDGRVGPLFLLLLPAALWAVWQTRQAPQGQRRTVLAIGLFGAISALFWGTGVINSSALWQTRLLFPALMPLAILMALGIVQLRALDTPVLRLSYLLNLVIGGVLVLTLFDFGLFVLARNPLAVASGLEPKAHYMARVQPDYSQALDLLAETPPDSRVYFLFEPRSYGAPRPVQPDPILDNFAHLLFLHGNADGIAAALREQGYTHVLVFHEGADFLISNRPDKLQESAVEELDRLTGFVLRETARTKDGTYRLYETVEP